jgi:hypothetical protein
LQSDTFFSLEFSAEKIPVGPELRGRRWRAVAIIVCALAAPARAERPVHGSVGGGSSLLLTGAQGDRLRYELEVDIEPKSRYGGHIAWRAFDDTHHGILVGGLVYEAGAARPRLVVDLHADVGADLDQKAPVVGGGIRTTLTIYKMIGIALDGGAYLVIDGVDDTRLVLAGSTSLVIRW